MVAPKSQIPEIETVETPQEVLEGIKRFNVDARDNLERARSLIRTTDYWVYDAASDAFGPSKFVGYRRMDFETYESAQSGKVTGARFDGSTARAAIERAFSSEFRENRARADALARWANGILGSGALDGLNSSRWKFVDVHPTAGRRRYWKIAPGSQANKWDEFRQQQIIAIGWDESLAGDLSKYPSFDALLAELKARKPEDSERSIRIQAGMIWSFAHDVQPGDIVVANRGRSQVIGLGRVVGPYRFDKTREDFRHVIPVDWFDVSERDVPDQGGGWMKTVFEIPEEQFQALEKGDVLKSSFDAILDEYARAQQSAFKDTPIREHFNAIREALATLPSVKAIPTLFIESSYGKGKWAYVPWVAALDSRITSTIKNGVYIVYLFAADMSGVYVTLNQGVTETIEELGRAEGRATLKNRARELREKLGTELLRGGFKLDDDIDLRVEGGVGPNYESSTIAYKFYPKGGVPTDRRIEEDLGVLIKAYMSLSDGEGNQASTRDLSAVVADFSQSLSDANITFGARQEEMVRAFVTSLATKRFVILTGLSGSGKSQLAIRFGDWLGENQSVVISVRPDWTGPEFLFGYEDSLQESKGGRKAWVVPKALEFILQAARNPDEPHLLTLDEMNLAHVERYFADALSGMESGVPCLPSLVEEEDGAWRKSSEGTDLLVWPDNLFIVGTVNVDETTYLFSPKVLDRANTIEFRVRTEDLSDSMRKPTRADAGPPELVKGFLDIARDDRWQIDNPASASTEFAEHLRTLHGILAEGGFEFGHRTFYEALRFAAIFESSGGDKWIDALDLQVLQKVLPRLHGARRKLEGPLCAVGAFCFALADAKATEGFDPLKPPPGAPRLPASFEKVQRMLKNLRHNQFASFAE